MFVLALSVGESVTVTPDDRKPVEAEIVGSTVDTADSQSATAVLFDAGVTSKEATLWLSDRDPYSVKGLQQLMDARAITYRSTESVVKAALAQPTEQQRVLAWGLLALGGPIALLVAAVVAAQVSTGRRTAEDLLASGLPLRRVWWLLVGTVTAALSSGIIAGSVAAHLGLVLLRDSAASVFGQVWTDIYWAMPTVIVSVSLCWLVAAVVRPALSGASRLSERLASARLVGRTIRFLWTRVVVGTAVLVAAVLAAQLESPPGYAAMLGLFGALACASAVPALILRVGSHRVGRTTRIVLSRVSFTMRVVTVTAMVVAITTGTYAASQAHNIDASRQLSAQNQPADSLLLIEVPQQAASTLTARYQDLGGQRVVRYELVDESSSSLRVTSPGLVECMEQANTLDPNRVDPDCFPQRTFTPIAQVVLDTTGGTTNAQADPDLVGDGAVGLLPFDSGRAAASGLATTEAVANADLGGNMPGLVLPASGTVARHFDLRPSGTEFVGLMDFGELEPRARAQLRAAISRLAPAAQVADSDEADPFRADQQTARAVAIVGAVVVAIIVLLGGLSALIGERRTFLLLLQLGVPRERLVRARLLWIAVPIGGFAVAVLLTCASAQAFQTTLPGDSGTAWMAPLAAGFGSALLLVWSLWRLPSGITTES